MFLGFLFDLISRADTPYPLDPRTMSIRDYLRDVHGELRHVSWPSKSQTINYTIIVLALSLGTGVFLGLADFLFKETLARFI